MQRFFRLSLFVAFLAFLAFGEGMAQKPQEYVSGRIDPGVVRIFENDKDYIIDNEYQIFGTLIIEPGTDIYFYPNSRWIVFAGGRVIADGDALATYIANPGGIDPMATPGSSRNPNGYDGYSDLDYFLYSGVQSTVNVGTTRDLTVHSSKYNTMFNVVLDKAGRAIMDLDPNNVPTNPNYAVIPFEQAIMFKVARLANDPDFDVNLRLNPWSRIGGKSVQIASNTIRFIGQPVNRFSREWGHVIVMPGARAAFFRNVSFEGFKKDITVDRLDIEDSNQPGLNWDAISGDLTLLTNGSGGAITTFSSRTWLLDVDFSNNIARFHGGALQLLQAPAGFPATDTQGLGSYPANKNPNITNRDGSISSINSYNPIPLIDNIDNSTPEPLSDVARQSLDDGRLALYLGRMRNMKFDGNMTQIANVITKNIGGWDVVVDDVDNPADYPIGNYGDGALGGAIFMAGRVTEENRAIEVGLGINNSIMIDGREVRFTDFDTFEAYNNTANNYQSNGYSPGARGGAIYVGRYTALIVAGQFHSNETYAKFLQDNLTGSNSGPWSMGGAIFTENTLGRLQVRGGTNRDNIDNITEFIGNKAGAGGAIFVDGNTDQSTSPVIGGSDETIATRNYGFDVTFENNQATSFGGAILSKRNIIINGSGGVEAGELIGYGGKHPVRFNNNSAGYSGGALALLLPNGNPIPAWQRVCNITRASFRENVVGLDIDDLNRPEIRGGGAIYALSSDLNVVKAVEFINNKVYNGNGGAIAMVNPLSSSKRFFLSDLDMLNYDYQSKLPDHYDAGNGPFIYSDDVPYPADTRMLTRFIGNEIEVDQEILDTQSGSGTTQHGKGMLKATSLLHATDWVDAYTGYAVGYNGTIIKFTQGGNDWNNQNSGTTYRLTSVYFADENIGWVAGDRGIILKTTDGGNNWVRKSVATDRQINAIQFIGTNVGFAACDDGYVLKTTDGGENWSISQPHMSDFAGIYFVNQNTGWIVGDRGLILKTTDGGMNWDVQFVPGLNANLNNVSFLSTSFGFIGGDAGTFVKTEDGGNTWEVVATGANYNIESVFFTNQNTGFFAGQFGTLYMTTDAGDTWTELDPGSSYSFYDVFFPTSTTGFLVGDYGLVLGTTDGGATWTEIVPDNGGIVDVTRYHQEIMLPENGVGLGGAIYILDSVTVNRVNRADTVFFNRVRFQDNKSFTGAAIYSDNFDLKLIFNRSLVTGNAAFSEIGVQQNAITGPIERDQNDDIVGNELSSDLAPAIIYGEIQGPLPSYIFSEAANSMYDNYARFLIRLPDAPNTKGVLAGTTGIGFGGTDTLRGNYWGHTEANVNLIIENLQGRPGVIQETFFIATDGEFHLPFMYNPATPNEQGPFEFNGNYTYTPVPLANGADEYTPEVNTIPETLLMSGQVYDMYDKGTDIKTADYTLRRMSPIEDFAVGIPPTLRRFDVPGKASFGKYVKRWVRDPFTAEMVDDQGEFVYPFIAALQDEFEPDAEGNYYHPIGYPLYLETKVNYEGLAERSNHIENMLNETVFFVINEITGDYIRVNLSQHDDSAPFRESFRARVELVPDSTNRNPNPTIRRTEEGLLNIGSGDFLLRQLEDNPYIEDRATLPGRKYDANDNAFAKVPNLFSNRPDMPPANNGRAAFFSGERFNSLPVNIGDRVRIISRTVLWKEGVIPAYDDGVAFDVIESTEPPVFTGDIVELSENPDTLYVPSQYPWKRALGLMDTIIRTDKLNRIWVTEDRYYPVAPGVYSNRGYDAGRDSIMTVTAIDTNGFYDPRSIQSPDDYASLGYSWSVNSNSGLARWLQADLVEAGQNDRPNPKDGALGYLMFRGQPINPYVVPGGETVEIKVNNYPPNWRVVDAINQMWADGILTDQDMYEKMLDKAIETFPSYYNAANYDIANARFLQQDTIDFGSIFEREYEFDIFVVDSVPRVLDPGYDEVVNMVDEDGNIIREVVHYTGSEFKCAEYQPEDGRLLANVTDKLRFQFNINTDDELEDAAAYNWDWRYGRTSYGFLNRVMNGGDDIVIDTADVLDENGDPISFLDQARPAWMADNYLTVYGTDDEQDVLGVDWTMNGELNFRIPYDDAVELLTPLPQHNGALNLDTVVNIVVNDGHGGMIARTYGVFINMVHEIITESLPPAKEDVEYNMTEVNGNQLIDSTKMIQVFDANFGQYHTFTLIYSDYPDDQIPKDRCFEEAGFWDVSNLKVTPDWLKINEASGILFGIPRVTDAPKDEQVVVLVEDENGLTVVKVLDLRVDSTNHAPRAISSLEVICLDRDGEYSDTIKIWDHDLLRDVPGEEETVNISVLKPAGFQVEPSTISGPLANDTLEIRVYSTDLSGVQADNDGRVTIEILLDDGEETYVYRYRIKLSDPTDFVSTIRVENSIGAYQDLQWGTAQNATTGDGTDNDDKGKLDPQYCEYEIPPVPVNDVFDSRWSIPLVNGTHVNIYPTSGSSNHRYRSSFQSGGVLGGGNPYYPITLTWDMTDIPDKDDATLNPEGSSWYLRDATSDGNLFNVHMHNGYADLKEGIAAIEINGNEVTVVVLSGQVEGFVIFRDINSDVDDDFSVSTEISSVIPNPIANQATVRYSVTRSSDIRLEVVDVLGNVVNVLVNDYVQAGEYVITMTNVNSQNVELPSGTYMIRMVAGQTISTYPVAIVK